jgi:rhamnogalacturonyl hydrolase YesR
MIYEGLVDEGLELIAAIRHRYDGQRRNPFDEAECGHHYARAMASWAAVLALTGFHYDAHDAALTFTDLPVDKPVFWSTGDGWGTITVSPDGTSKLDVHQGTVRIRSATSGSAVARTLERPRELVAGDSITI